MEMMKKLFTIIICICAVTAQAQKPNNEALRKLQMAEFAITNLYVDKVDEDKLVEEAIIKMLAQLDPHSTYNNAEEVKKMNEPLQGNFEGIGVQFQMIEDTLLVIQPVSNGPSEKAGILAGDRIIAVGCLLPLTANNNLSRDLGTRHRAAIGLSEVTDAVIIVVSEETGKISIALNGSLTRNLSRESLAKALKKIMSQKQETNEKIDKIMFWRTK